MYDLTAIRTTFLALLLTFAVWTLVVWAGILMSLSFDAVASYSWLLPLVFVVSSWNFLTPSRSPIVPADSTTSTSRHGNISYILAASGVIMVTTLLLSSLIRDADSDFLLPYLAISAATLIGGWWVSNQSIEPSPSPISTTIGNAWIHWSFYLLIVGICFLLYDFSRITNADDTHFLGTARSLLERPDAVLFSVDPIFGDSSKGNLIFIQNLGQSYEALAALISRVTGIDLLFVYYRLLPAIACLLFPLPAYLFLRRYFGIYAWAGILIAVFMLWAWGPHNHNDGYFFIPRLYQGKSWLVSIIVPTLFWSVRNLAHRPSLKNWVIVTAAMISGAGLSSTGLYLAPLVAAIAFLAFVPLKLDAATRLGIRLVMSMVPNLLMALYLYFRMSDIRKLPTAGLRDSQGNTDLSIVWAYGDTVQLGLVIAIALLVFWGVRIWVAPTERLEVVRFWTFAILLGLNDPLASVTANLLGVGNIQWRWHWAFPAGLAFASAGAAMLLSARWLMRRQDTHRRHLSTHAMTSGVLLAAFFAVSWGAISGRYSPDAPALKMNPSAFRAAKLTAVTVPDGTVLVDYRIAEILPVLDWEGKLIGARELYWLQPYFSPEETLIRHRLQSLTNTPGKWRNEDLDFLAQKIERYRIRLMVTHDTGTNSITNRLFREIGWTCRPEEEWLFCLHPELLFDKPVGDSQPHRQN